jgi:hypothetical protein
MCQQAHQDFQVDHLVYGFAQAKRTRHHCSVLKAQFEK